MADQLNWVGMALWFSGLGMGFVLSIMLRLDQIEAEENHEHVDRDHV